MAESTNNLSLVLNQQDASGVNILQRTIGAVSYAGSVGEFIKGTLATSGAEAQTMPIANVLQFYIKNTSAVAKITITATVQGGAALVAARLTPGGTFVNWQSTSGATVGYTAITLTGDVTGATYEAFYGG